MINLHIGDCRDVLKTLPDESVQCVVTSPPYYGLRDYGEDGQIGLEQTPDDYVAEMVAVFREVRRVLRDDGTVWLNLGDSYAGGGGYYPNAPSNQNGGSLSARQDAGSGAKTRGVPVSPGLKPKDLIGIPWRVAFALQADGWWLRQDIIWHKPNPMPESVTDRCTKAHEYVFLLSKSARYYYDHEAVKEENADPYRKSFLPGPRKTSDAMVVAAGDKHRGFGMTGKPMDEYAGAGRNRRSVWTIATTPYSGAHFATFPPSLIEPMILAGTSEHGACSVCGAPWERVVEKTAMVVRPGPSRDARSQDGQLRTQINGTMLEPPTSTTTGWRATCDHADAPVVPCAVLDFFSGAGTTGLVADRLGRDAILIELNAEYAEMARRRIVGDAPMFARVEVMA